MMSAKTLNYMKKFILKLLCSTFNQIQAKMLLHANFGAIIFHSIIWAKSWVCTINFMVVEVRLSAVEYLLLSGTLNGNVGREATTLGLDARKAHRDVQKAFIDVC